MTASTALRDTLEAAGQELSRDWIWTGNQIKLGPGTLYGSLDRLMRDALVEETGMTDDDRRRYYRLTQFGARVLAAETGRLSAALRTARARVPEEVSL